MPLLGPVIPQVLQPGGLLTVMAYTGHPGGQEEYEAVGKLLKELSPAYWVSSELRVVNRPTAPVLLLVWRRTDADVERCMLPPRII